MKVCMMQVYLKLSLFVVLLCMLAVDTAAGFYDCAVRIGLGLSDVADVPTIDMIDEFSPQQVTSSSSPQWRELAGINQPFDNQATTTLRWHHNGKIAALGGSSELQTVPLYYESDDELARTGDVKVHLITDAGYMRQVERYICEDGVNIDSAIVLTATCLAKTSDVPEEGRANYQWILAYGGGRLFVVIMYWNPLGFTSIFGSGPTPSETSMIIKDGAGQISNFASWSESDRSTWYYAFEVTGSPVRVDSSKVRPCQDVCDTAPVGLALTDQHPSFQLSHDPSPIIGQYSFNLGVFSFPYSIEGHQAPEVEVNWANTMAFQLKATSDSGETISLWTHPGAPTLELGGWPPFELSYMMDRERTGLVQIHLLESTHATELGQVSTYICDQTFVPTKALVITGQCFAENSYFPAANWQIIFAVDDNGRTFHVSIIGSVNLGYRKDYWEVFGFPPYITSSATNAARDLAIYDDVSLQNPSVTVFEVTTSLAFQPMAPDCPAACTPVSLGLNLGESDDSYLTKLIVDEEQSRMIGTQLPLPFYAAGTSGPLSRVDWSLCSDGCEELLDIAILPASDSGGGPVGLHIAPMMKHAYSMGGTAMFHLLTDTEDPERRVEVDSYICDKTFQSTAVLVVTGSCLAYNPHGAAVHFQVMVASGHTVDNEVEGRMFAVIVYATSDGGVFLTDPVEMKPGITDFINWPPNKVEIPVDVNNPAVFELTSSLEIPCQTVPAKRYTCDFTGSLAGYSDNTMLIGYKINVKTDCKFKLVFKDNGNWIKFGLGPQSSDGDSTKFFRFLEFCAPGGDDFSQSGQGCKGPLCQNKEPPLKVKKGGKVFAKVEKDVNNSRKYIVTASKLCAGPDHPGYILTVECRDDGDPIVTINMDGEFFENRQGALVGEEDLSTRCTADA